MSFPERIVPDETAAGIVALHLKRYEFATPHCEGADVLDAGCGVGYGSAYLADHGARSVLGADGDRSAIAYARRRYGRDNVQFKVMDVAQLDLADQSIDVVCAFEVIEHLAAPETFLGEVARVLRSGGSLILSTPRANETTSAPANPFHEVEYSQADLGRLLGQFFADVELYGQRRLQTRRHRALQRADVLGLRKRSRLLRSFSWVLGTRPMETVSSNGIAISRERIERASELVAVCTGRRAR